MAKTITKLPDAPSVERPGSFNQDADKFVRALGKFTDEANALALAVETAAKTVQDAAFSAQPILDAKDEALRAISAATTQLAAAQNIKADAEKSAQKAQSAAQAIEAAKNSLASAGATLEEMKKIVSNGFIDDTTINESRTYSSKKIDETYAKKGETSGSVDVSGLATKEELGAKIDEMKANELIAAKTATLATKDELYDKLTTTIYESDKATFALKSQLSAYATTAQLNNCVTQSALNKYTKAQNITSNTIDFMQGVNFTGSVSGQITAGVREAGQSGLVYISGNGVTGFSSDFVILNPSEATYGQGYVFFSYFVRPADNKVLISFIKAA